MSILALRHRFHCQRMEDSPLYGPTGETIPSKGSTFQIRIAFETTFFWVTQHFLITQHFPIALTVIHQQIRSWYWSSTFWLLIIVCLTCAVGTVVFLGMICAKTRYINTMMHRQQLYQSIRFCLNFTETNQVHSNVWYQTMNYWNTGRK